MQGKTDVRARRSYAGVIEIETETVVTRAGRGAGAATITAIVQALKARRWSARVVPAFALVDLQSKR